jgi:hypothetical protein
MSIITTTPTTPSVSGLILPGTVAAGSSEPLPGVCIGCLNSSTSHAQLAAAVAAYNASVQSGSLINANGTKPSFITLPQNYTFGTPTISQDFRLTKEFHLPGKERLHFNVFAEMFNAFNISNKGGPSMTFDSNTTNNSVCQQGSVVTNPATGLAAQSCSFGQSTSRPGQTLGSAGPRAVQVGARFTF